MKKLVQNSGVRKWYGDEWVTIQDELNAVIEGHFSAFGAQFILSGCVVTDASVSAGLVLLNHLDGFKVCRLPAASGLSFPCYLKPVKTEETRLYLDGATKPVAYTYSAEISATNEGGYLELKADNTTPRFTDVIQDATHRFVSDDEKTSYAGQAAAAVTALRGGVDAAFDTLEKLRADLQDQIDTIEVAGTDYELIYSTIRGGIDESMDTLEKLRAAMVGRNLDWAKITNVPEYKGRAALATALINWAGKPEIYKTILENTLFDAENLEEGKTIGLLLDGAFESTFAAKFKKVAGSPAPSPTELNYVQMKCLNATVGSELIIYSVMYIES
ncbi:MAG: hypothetical protein JXQ80_13010 [Bacteroidales bacterium]|nr:hypothetical protein [Bacteroidales bacterium]